MSGLGYRINDATEGSNPSLRAIDALAVPEFVDRNARLAKLDEQGVEACLMLPTAGVGIEPQLRTPRHREALYPSELSRRMRRWEAGGRVAISAANPGPVVGHTARGSRLRGGEGRPSRDPGSEHEV